MGVFNRGEHQLDPDNYPNDASRIAWGGKVLLFPALGTVLAGTELFDAAVRATTQDGHAMSCLEQASEVGILTVAGIVALDTAEHWLIRHFRH